MPIYNLKCPNCELVEEDVFLKNYKNVHKCKRCRASMITLVPMNVGADCFPQKGVFLEHVSADGKWFNTKTDMKDYAKKNDLELGYLV